MNGPWPIRALWAWPLATGSITAVELTVRSSRQSFDVVAFGLGCCSGIAMGAWLALLTVLLAVLANRRGWGWPARFVPGPEWVARLATGAVLGSIVALLGWWTVDVGFVLFDEHPADYAQTLAQLLHAVVLVAGPIAVIVVLFCAAPISAWLRHGRRASVALRTTAAIAWVAIAAQFASGSFALALGSIPALALLGSGAWLAAAWLPSQRAGGGGASWLAAWVVATVLGVLGLQHEAARSLLLHRARLVTTLADVGFGWLDGDGDAELPGWLGGGDCDDGDPAIGSARPEIVGNGVDDNCWGGDRATARPAPVAMPQPSGAKQPPPLLLVTIDTVRVDHLELYGAARQTMPALAQLAARGLVFDRAYAPANHTFYSMMSVLAGQSPESMLVPVAHGVPKLSFTRWLPQELRKRGYHVVAIGPPLVSDGKLPVNELRVDEVDIGPFDFVGKNRGTTSRQLADSAIRVIERWQGDAPLAVWVHFMDPHAVHESAVRFAVNDVRDAYDNELSWVDMHMARIIDALGKRYRDDALVVVTSDHGESFGEDGDWGHGFTLFERDVRVPLVLAGAGVGVGRPLAPVSLVSLAPTVLALLDGGEPLDLPELLGASRPVVVANPAFLWNELRMEVALVELDRKLVWSRTTNTLELFDLASDPHERRNLASAQPAELARMLGVLRDELESVR
jgi:arylsulfatase A-like enzyme